VLGSRVADRDRTVTSLHEIAQFRIDLARRHIFSVELGLATDVDRVGERLRKVFAFRGRKELLLCPSFELFGVHTHPVGCMFR